MHQSLLKIALLICVIMEERVLTVQEKDGMPWLVLASWVVTFLRSASENKSHPAFFSEQASLTNAQGRSLVAQKTWLSLPSKCSEKWGKGQRDQASLTPRFLCKLINSEFWSCWNCRFYPFQSLLWGWCCPVLYLTKSSISELKRSSEPSSHTCMLPSKVPVISTGEQVAWLPSVTENLLLTNIIHYSVA